MGESGGSSLRLYWRALKQVRPWWPGLGAVLALGILWTPISLLVPLPVKIILDSVTGQAPLPSWLAWLPGGPEAALGVALGLSVGITALVLAHNTAEWLLRESLTERVVRDMRRRLAARSLEVSAQGSEGERDTGYRISHDAPSLPLVTIYGLMPLITAATSLVVLVAVTSRLSPLAAGLALATSVPMAVLVQMNQRRMRAGWHGTKETEARALDGVLEAVSAWRVVVSCGQEGRVLERFEGLSRDAFRRKLRVMGLEALLGCTMTLGVALGTAAILWVSVRAVQAGTMTAGDLILVTAYVAQLYGPIQTIAGHVSNQQSALASVERSFAVLDREPTVRERPGAAPMGRARGAVEFRDVAFGYGPGRPVVRDVSFRVPAGSWVGISGPSGTGKSTLTNLLVRFLDPEQGSIRLDGRDLRDIRLADLRRQFALLGQDGHLVAGTVEENIAFACPGPGREAVERAARLAQADGFVSALPEGYGTVVGGPGCRLSGGQRQRVALARALLRDAPVVVLDEPTSALDEDTERAVIAELRRSLAGRTVFVVTHRPSVLAVADLALHLRDGTVVVEDRCAAEPPERLVA